MTYNGQYDCVKRTKQSKLEILSGQKPFLVYGTHLTLTYAK